jgi:hypothetical protein
VGVIVQLKLADSHSSPKTQIHKHTHTHICTLASTYARMHTHMHAYTRETHTALRTSRSSVNLTE